jgi:aspartyl-tRNA(Asn)/glutamyl-tRNA(Gln) amidotransferase subunit A
MAAAEAADDRWDQATPLSPYDGIPIAIKDNIDVAGLPTSCGFSFRATAKADNDAVIIARLKACGLIPLGKTNMPEGAIGGTTANAHFGRTENPWGKGLVPGGSSGGSAAAIAGGLAPVAIGTDSLGSIRIPASYCGIAGLKPTFGLVSNRGLRPLSFSLDTIGPMARRVSDLAPIMEMIAGYDPLCLAARPGSFHRSAIATIAGLRIGYVPAIKSTAFAPSVDHMMAQVQTLLRDHGAELVEINLDAIDLPRLRRRLLMICEVEGALAYEADLADHGDDIPGPLMDMLAFGSRQPGVLVARARREIAMAGAHMRGLLSDLDALILPTTSDSAFAFSEPVPGDQADFVSLANAARVPSLSLACGLDPRGRPLGLQVMGREFSDGQLLALGEWIDAHLGPIGLPPSAA